MNRVLGVKRNKTDFFTFSIKVMNIFYLIDFVCIINPKFRTYLKYIIF